MFPRLSFPGFVLPVPDAGARADGQKIRRRRMLATGGMLAALLLLFHQGSPAQAAAQAVSGCIPSAIQQLGLTPVGSVPANQTLHLAIGLALKDQAGLAQFVREVSDPSSPNFRHYLTPAEVAQRFSPSESDYAGLVAFARSHQLQVTDACANRVVLSVEGSAAAIETAFHVHLLTYNHPTEARTFFAPDVEPTLDTAVPVLSISGLNSYVLPHAMSHLRASAGGQGVPQDGSGPSGSYMGYDFRRAYVPTTTLTGAGETVGLLEFDSGFYQADVAAYETQAGLPPVPVTAVLLDGYGGGPGYGNDEVSLDIDMAVSMSPGANQVLVYEGDQTNTILGRMSTDTSVLQFGASWSYDTDLTSENLWLVMAAQGQSFYNASGDSDAYVFNIPTPCDDPNIMIVGGTTLNMTSGGGAFISETVWNWGGGVGGSGGISPTHTIPSWQTGLDLTNAQGSSSHRNIPDISMVGDNIYVIYHNGRTGVFGGTSCSTPLWAAYTALINQEAVADNLPAPGFVNPVLYALGKTTTDNCLYRDCIAGDNTWRSSPTKFFAVNGFDLGTGWGTPTEFLIDAILGINTSGCWNLSAGVAPGTAGAQAGPLVAPNPSAGHCSVSFSLPTPGRVDVSVLDVNGRLVRRLVSGDQASGRHSVSWDGRDDAGRSLAGGVYLARVQTRQGVQMRKVVLAP